MTTKPKIAIACDHAGLDLKNKVKEWLSAEGYPVTDYGTNSSDSVHYPEYANHVAQAILTKKAELGILICGSGIGMSIAANRHKGIRAALVHNVETATLSRQHNNANIICLGARIIPEALAKECVSAFLNTAFEGGRHEIRTLMMG